MNNLDKQYQALLQDIHYTNKSNIFDGFPILLDIYNKGKP